MKNSNGLLVSVPAVVEMFGIPLSDVQILIDGGILQSVIVGTTTYVTKPSIASFLNVSMETLNLNEIYNGYRFHEELSSSLINDNKKEGNAMTYTGSISALSDGRFMVQVNLGKSNTGKRNRESKSFKNKDEAQDYLDKRLYELNQQIEESILSPCKLATPPMNETIKNYSKLTFEAYAYQKISGGIGRASTRTLESYRGGVERILPYIGKICISQLTKQDIENALQQLTYRYADSSIAKTYQVVKMLINEATAEDDIPKNVMLRVRCPKSTVPKTEEKYPVFTDDELNTILSLSKHYDRRLFAIFCLLSSCGMRPAELRCLELTDFDPVAKTISIRQAGTQKYEKINSLNKAAPHSALLSVTKSPYSVRTMQLTDIAVEALTDWIEFNSKSRNKLRAESNFIFPNQNGSFMSASALENAIERFNKKFALEDMAVHAYKFRHTMCTKWIEAGLPVKVIQALMGDNSLDVIMDIYAHLDRKKALKMAAPFYEELNDQYSNISNKKESD